METSINFSQIDLGIRLRKTYSNIESLADSILHNGLINPLVLVNLPDGGYGLDAGGRRYRALELLLTEGEWDGVLHHAVTSDRTRFGYLLKGETGMSPLQRKLTELAENLDREDPDWRDVVPALCDAWELAQGAAAMEGRKILQRDFGALVGCGYHDLDCAIAIRDELLAHPKKFEACTTIRQAYSVMMRESEVAVSKIIAARALSHERTRPKVTPTVVALDGQQPVTDPVIEVSLTEVFHCCSSLDYMATTTDRFDHIVTDPDYAVAIEVLSAGVGNAAAGIYQESVEASLRDLLRFVELAYRVVRDNGFVILWYDLDHHEKIQRHAMSVGFSPQRWPLIWIKSDYRANAAPGQNFCKNIEYAMVLRKSGAALARAQMSSTFTTPSAGVQKDYNHPFAKPLDLTKWILNAIAIKGQSVFDPFMGSAAISCAVAEWGAIPFGCEIAPERYANALYNLQRTYKKIIGSNIHFT